MGFKISVGRIEILQVSEVHGASWVHVGVSENWGYLILVAL